LWDKFEQSETQFRKLVFRPFNFVSTNLGDLEQIFFITKNRRSLYTEVHYPLRKIPPKKLDEYLAEGWFRMGQTIFTCWFLFMERGFYSAIWIRQDLENFTFKKRSRKIMNRNGLSGASFSIYDTRQIEIYDGDKLIAASFFDVGLESVASISGIFDPAYGQHSLGFYTMLLEMQFSLDQGKRFYYPGYIVPGNPRFDYKARIGAVDYYNLYTKKWYPLEDMDVQQIPSTLLEDLLKHPMYLRCISTKFRHFDLFAVYDLVAQKYQLGIYYNLDDFSDWMANKDAQAEGPFSYSIYMLGEVISEKEVLLKE